MEISERQQIEQRNICKLLKESDEIVISGMGGRFPLSNKLMNLLTIYITTLT